MDGVVTETEREAADEFDTKISQGISLADAIAKAKEQAADGGKFLDEADFDKKTGQLGFEIEFDNGQGEDLDSFFVDFSGNVTKN